MGRGRPPTCPYCKKTRSVMKGYRYNKMGIVKLRRCLACKRRWTAGPASKGNKPPSRQAGGNPPAEPQPAVPMIESAAEIDRLDKDRNLELTLSGEGSPSHYDPGREERTMQNGPLTLIKYRGFETSWASFPPQSSSSSITVMHAEPSSFGPQTALSVTSRC